MRRCLFNPAARTSAHVACTGRGAIAAAPAQALCAGRDHAAGRFGRRELHRVPRGARRRRQNPPLCRARAAGAGAGLFLGPRLRPALRSAQARGGQSRRRDRAGTAATAPAGMRSRHSPRRPRSSRCDSRPGVVCAPARPGYDGVAFSKLLDSTYTTGIDWAYPRADETPVRAAPQPGAAEVGTLGPHFVRLLGFEGADSEPAPRPHPMGARRPARRQAGLCRPRQPDVADRRTALLHQGLGRRLADRRIYRRGQLAEKDPAGRT